MAKRTVNIHGKDYEVVASRVERFRKDHPDWAILPKILHIDKDRVVVQAVIKTEVQRSLAIGHAEEYRASSRINQTSALENCETSAIGRALAALGYIGGEYASADEVANAVNNQSKDGSVRKPSPKQIKYLIQLAGSEKSLESLAGKKISEITFNEVDGLIKEAQAEDSDRYAEGEKGT